MGSIVFGLSIYARKDFRVNIIAEIVLKFLYFSIFIGGLRSGKQKNLVYRNYSTMLFWYVTAKLKCLIPGISFHISKTIFRNYYFRYSLWIGKS